jgi:hypothetical protein
VPGFRPAAPAAVGVAELGWVAEAAEGRRMPTGPGRREVHLMTGVAQRLGLTSESRVRVALIRVAASVVRDVPLGSAGGSVEPMPASYPNPA